MKDVLGKEIMIGNYIAYGIRSGNSGDLRIGRVIDTKEEIEISVYNEKEYSRVITEIKVRGLNFWSGEAEVGKQGILQHPNRVVVLDIDSIPQKIRDLYKGL